MSTLEIQKVFEQIGPELSLVPFQATLEPLIEETLKESGQAESRKGTLLVPRVLVWLVLAMSMRRDLNCRQVLNWMVSGYRWLSQLIPPKAYLIAEGTISHARVRMGVDFFRRLFAKLTGRLPDLTPDFQGRVSVMFDGSTGTMPDTPVNSERFGKPKSRQGASAFP